MSAPEDTSGTDRHGEDRNREALNRAARRRRLAEVFGDVLPDSSADDRPAKADQQSDASRDAELLRDVPPHHGERESAADG